MKEIKDKVEEILKAHPQMNYEGMALPFIRRESISSKKERLLSLREKAISEEGIAEVSTVIYFLENSKKYRKTKSINTKNTSFGLKTYVEDATGKYISNGSFILGSILSGLKIKQVRDTIHAQINIRMLSAK